MEKYRVAELIQAQVGYNTGSRKVYFTVSSKLCFIVITLLMANLTANVASLFLP
jgi:hypothetical protein